MSKNIESIIIATRNDELDREETKVELKTLLLEIIGENENGFTNREATSTDGSVYIVTSIGRAHRNKLRAELRKKIEEL